MRPVDNTRLWAMALGDSMLRAGGKLPDSPRRFRIALSSVLGWALVAGLLLAVVQAMAGAP